MKRSTIKSDDMPRPKYRPNSPEVRPVIFLFFRSDLGIFFSKTGRSEGIAFLNKGSHFFSSDMAEPDMVYH